MSITLKLLKGCQIVFMALTLIEDVVVPVQVVALEGVEYIAAGPRHFAQGVDVFDAYQPLTLMGVGIAVACHGRQQGADVQRTGGRGRKTANVGGLTWCSCRCRKRDDPETKKDAKAPFFSRNLSHARQGSSARDQVPHCFSLISSRVLQSMQSVAVGRASRRRTPISIPQASHQP
jgi:hypothetical protein